MFDFPGSSDEEVGNVAFTDENGNYVMTGLSAGQHRLEFVDALEFNLFGDGPESGRSGGTTGSRSPSPSGSR